MKNYFNLKKSKLLLLTLLTMLVVGARPAWAQKSLPYSYGFEDNNLATDGWTTQNPSGRNNHEFGINSYARKTGSYGFRFSSLVENGENTQYLISPELNASREIELTFEYRGSDIRASEKFKVGYSTTNTDIASFTFDGDEYTANDDSWATFRGNFPAGTKYIAVYYYTDGKYQLYVDDFSFKLACPAPTNLTATNVTPTSATLNWEGNAESYNVRYRKLVFFDDFENGLGNWTTYTMGDAAAWGTEDPSILGLSGHNSSTNVAFSLSWDDGVSYHADNWLVTPQVQLGGTLKFYVYTNQSYPDAYEVKLSTGGNTIDDFTVTLQELASIPTTGDWVEVNIDLSSYEGQSGYIAIHHSFYDGNYILVDDFSIYPPQEAGEWIEATSTTNSFDITGLTPGTTYEFQVRANYGSEDGLSQWSAVATFTVNYPWAGSGTADDPFQIQNVDDWNTLAANVTGGETYSGIYFKMTDDIIGVTTRTGKNSLNPFSGTFDGQGHTMNLNIYSTTTADVTSAPFGSISGATIKNLHVTGSETTTAYMRAASIAGFAANSTITNCWSEVALTSGYNKDIDCGAFVATVIENSSLTLNGCLFTGTITYTNAAGYEGGGMVGWTRAGSTATLNDCLFAPAGFTVTKYSGHYMFVGGKKRGVLNNCYYNDVAAATSLTKEGKQAFSIVKGDDVSSLAISGEGTEYSVSGITAYATGIKYNDVYYAGSGEAVGLTLSHADAATGYSFDQYTASAGTLSGTTLTMPDADVTISATWTKNTKTLAETATDNQAWLTENDGQVYEITLTRTLQTGGWNTFCVPFSTETPSGWTVKELSSSAFDSSTGELTLNFGNAASIEAGKPYLVKVDANVENPTFNGVTISSTTTTTETTAVDFVPVMNPTNLTGGDKTVLFITDGNKLTYPSGDGNINGFRAYFKLKDEVAAQARAFRMSFDDNVTGITTVISDEPTTASGTYTLDGRRIEGEPTQKGMYIVNGKKVIK
ncbi:MAG: choice-of-anchor J domain-containing protein [Prevotella sp.]|nr:choice-of-anchor J domain-containing protein [Prevotella sp.]